MAYTLKICELASRYTWASVLACDHAGVLTPTGSSQVPMGVSFTAPVYSAAEGEGGDSVQWASSRVEGRQAAELDPAASNSTSESVPMDRGVTSNTCVCCAYKSTPSRITASNRRQPNRNRISGSQRIR